MVEPPQDLVARGYDEVAERYAALERDAPWPRLRWLDEVLRRLPDGAHVLDLGCGNGLPAGPRITRRHRLTGVDVSARQIEAATGNVPDGTFAVGDVLALEYPAGAFDAVVAFYTLDHVPRERLPELFGRIHGWLTEQGLLLFCVETDDQPGVVGHWLGTPMFFSSYPPDTLRRLLTGSGFEILLDRIEEQLEGDRPVTYLWVLARRSEAASSADPSRW